LDFYELSVKERATRGKEPAKVMRREGNIPAVLYGPDLTPVSLTVSINDLTLARKQSKTIQVFVNLKMENGDLKHAMLKELQVDPLSREYLHADFYSVSTDRKITTPVPVITTGKSIGVEYGGILQVIRRELNVICFPQDVPEKIEIDITDLEMNNTLHVDEIELEGDIEIPFDVNFTVISIVPPKGMDLDEDEAEDAEEDESTEDAEATEATEAE